MEHHFGDEMSQSDIEQEIDLLELQHEHNEKKKQKKEKKDLKPTGYQKYHQQKDTKDLRYSSIPPILRKQAEALPESPQVQDSAANQGVHREQGSPHQPPQGNPELQQAERPGRGRLQAQGASPEFHQVRGQPGHPPSDPEVPEPESDVLPRRNHTVRLRRSVRYSTLLVILTLGANTSIESKYNKNPILKQKQGPKLKGSLPSLKQKY